MEKKKATIILSGGHATTTALAVAEALRGSAKYDYELHWVGPKSVFEGIKNTSPELQEFVRLGVTIHTITAAKLQSKFTRYTIPALLKLPQSLFSAFTLFLKVRPDIVFCFGGSTSVPLAFIASAFRTPVVVHEQTISQGLANKFASIFATKVFLSRRESCVYYPKTKQVITGNPLRNNILKAVGEAHNSEKTLYITGGSRGAQRINEIIFKLVPELCKDTKIYHQTGSLDLEKARVINNSLQPKYSENYLPKSYFLGSEISDIYKKRPLVVGRSGANTVSELMSLSIFGIYIPIPWTRNNEQLKNSQYAEKLGLGYVLEEKNLTKEILMEKIHQFIDYKPKKGIFTYDLEARNKILTELEKILVSK